MPITRAKDTGSIHFFDDAVTPYEVPWRVEGHGSTLRMLYEHDLGWVSRYWHELSGLLTLWPSCPVPRPGGSMKFAIRIDAIWRPFMLFLGATPSNSYVEIAGGDILLHFGAGFKHTIARENVIGAGRRSWSLFDGLGVRAGGQIVGLIGSTGGVVELQLRDAVPLRFAGWPWVVHRIAISLEDPQGFIDMMTARTS